MGIKRSRQYTTYITSGVIACASLFIGIVLGLCIRGKWKVYGDIEEEQENNIFQYEVVENNIIVSDIKWTDYPNWRNVSCELNGMISVNLPCETNIKVIDIINEEGLVEVKRETKKEISKLVECKYDYVQYKLENVMIESKGLIKDGKNEIIAATQGYKIGFSWGNREYFIGYIPPKTEWFEEWGQQQNRYAEQNLSPYLGAFQLSRTYTDTSDLYFIDIVENIKLTKEGGLLDCKIENNGTKEWTFCDNLPTLEMWYKGVWIELITEWDSTLTAKKCSPKEKIVIDVSEKIENQYPKLFPGIYRLVIYGVEDDCVVSEIFLLEEE